MKYPVLVLLAVCALVLPATAVNAEAAEQPLQIRHTRLQTCVVATGPTVFKPTTLPRVKVQLKEIAYWRIEKIQVEDVGTTEIYRNPQGRCHGSHTVIRTIVVYITQKLTPVTPSNATPTYIKETPITSQQVTHVPAPKARANHKSHQRRPYGIEIGEPYGPVSSEPLHTESGGGG